MTDHLQSILDAFHDLLFVFNKEGIIKDYISTNHEDELILPKEVFLEKSHRNVLPPKVSSKLDQAFNNLDQGKEQDRFDYSLELNGQKQWYSAVLSKISDGDDPKYLGAVRNITDRKNQELLLRGILNTSPGGIIVLQAIRDGEDTIIDFEVTQINKSVEILTGASEKELVGQQITTIIADKAEEKMMEQFRTVVEKGNPVEFQYQYRDEQDQVLWYQVKVAKYRDGVIGNFLDITKQKKTEEKLAEKNEELEKLNQQKDKLFSVISHDLRNAVAGAKGMYDMIMEDYEELSKSEIFEYLKLLNQRTNNTHELLEDLLDWSKNQFQEVTTDLEKLHLVSITNTILNNVRSHAESKEINLINEIPDAFYVHADANMIKTVLRNLVTNGIKFSNPGRKIIMHAERKNQKIKVSVIDEGIGMDEETQKKVMNKEITHTSQGTSGEKGSGVGLDLCIDFVKKNGGEIWVESKLGKGSTFNFTIPEYS